MSAVSAPNLDSVASVPASFVSRREDRQTAITLWLMALGVGLALGLLVAAVLILLDAREDVWQEAQRSSTNLVQTLERDIARTFEAYDLALLGVMATLAQPDLMQASPALRHAAMFDRPGSAEYMGSFLVLDANGDIAYDSTSVTPHRLNLADRDFFQAQREPGQALFTSRPFHSRLRDGEPSIAVSRRLSGPSDECAGGLSGTLRLAYFDAIFAGLDLGKNGVVVLMNDSGQIVARRPSLDDDASHPFSISSIGRVITAGGSGMVQGVSAADGIERIFAFRQISNLPLHVAVGLSVPEFMAPWWRKAAFIGAILVGLAGASLAMCLLFRKEMKRRVRAEAWLRDAAQRLEQAANTDALTGLANRRAFQAALERAWRTAVRNGTGIALLMIDADAFKKFNDRYGHQEGDRVLHLIGEAIQGNLRRAADLGARYGGEEFAVLLPDTDAEGACQIAEHIRAEVRNAAIPHADSPDGFVSVSVGMSFCRPLNGEISGVLVRSADLALYDAKHTGRNRVCAAPFPPPSVAEAQRRQWAR